MIRLSELRKQIGNHSTICREGTGAARSSFTNIKPKYTAGQCKLAVKSYLVTTISGIFYFIILSGEGLVTLTRTGNHTSTLPVCEASRREVKGTSSLYTYEAEAILQCYEGQSACHCRQGQICLLHSMPCIQCLI